MTCVYETVTAAQPHSSLHTKLSLIYTGHCTFRRRASPPRAAVEGVDRTPGEDFFQKSSGQILPSRPLREASPPGYATRMSNCFEGKIFEGKKKSGNLKVGLGFVQTSVRIQWNPAYKAFHRIRLCGNEQSGL